MVLLVDDYAELVATAVANFKKCSEVVGGDVVGAASSVEAAFNAQKDFIAKISSMEDPKNQEKLAELLAATSSSIGAVQEAKTKSKDRNAGNFLAAMAEAIPALGWVMVSPAPAPFVGEMRDAGVFYSNRVLKDAKSDNEKNWAKAFVTMFTELQAYVKRHHTTGLVWNAINKAPAPAASAPSAGPVAGSSGAMVQAYYDDIINDTLKTFNEAGKAIGGEVEQVTELCCKTFVAQGEFLIKVSKSKNPDNAETFQKLLTDTSTNLGATQAYRDEHRKSRNLDNHFATLSESIPALGWVMVPDKPAPYVGDMKGAGEFFSNRILKEFKQSDEKQVAWAKAWAALFVALQKYVKMYHTTGLVWNKNGGDALKATTDFAFGSFAAALPSADGDDSSPATGGFMEAYDDMITNGPLKTFSEKAAAIGKEVEEASKTVVSAFEEQRKFLEKVSKAKDPKDPTVLQGLIKGMADGIGATQAMKDKFRKQREFDNHMTALAEGIPAIGWVMVPDKPSPHVTAMKEASDFYINRVVKDWKEKDVNHKEWAQAFSKLLTELALYVRKYHTTGLAWNNKTGVDAKSL
eukprot:Lithocolla_globosa_v1_NODE_2649_length_1920_cov_123.360858.p1 type:complete len:577 gc:universal NODE_2649_length_1920_cov_123.360858:1870-140(-)